MSHTHHSPQLQHLFGTFPHGLQSMPSHLSSPYGAASGYGASAAAQPMPQPVSLANGVAEININVKMPITDRQFLLVGPGNGRVKDLFKMIEDQHFKLFKEPVHVTYLKNDRGSVVDEDFAINKVFDSGCGVEAHGSPLADAHATLDILQDAADQDKRTAAAAAAAAAPEDEHAPAPKKRKTKDPNAPKRPPNAFMHFAKERRAQQPEGGPKGPAFMKQLGEEWQQMTEEDKEPYQQKADKEQVRYKDAKAKYELSEGGPAGRVPTEQTKRAIRRLMKKLGVSASERDEEKLRQLLYEYNIAKSVNKTKKWLIKQMEKIAQRDREVAE